MSNFDRVMDFVLKWEGGLSVDPNDPGGTTKYGISQRANPDVDVPNLTVEEAKEIYRERYWDRIGGDSLDYGTALSLMDFAVHSGVGTANNYFKNHPHPYALLDARLEYLASLKNFNTYGRGWTRRILDLKRELDKEVVPLDIEIVVLYAGQEEYKFRPAKCSIGPTANGRRKLMARLF